MNYELPNICLTCAQEDCTSKKCKDVIASTEKELGFSIDSLIDELYPEFKG